MKILVVSDSHRDIKYLYNVIVYEKPTHIFFTGDHSDDIIDMQYAFENIKFYITRGNCDYYDNVTKDIIEVELENIGKIILTHGHLFNVKSTMNDIYKFGFQNNANLVIFGHTHIQHKSEFKNIIFLNPGAIINHKYAVIENNQIEFKGEGF